QMPELGFVAKPSGLLRPVKGSTSGAFVPNVHFSTRLLPLSTTQKFWPATTRAPRGACRPVKGPTHSLLLEVACQGGLMVCVGAGARRGGVWGVWGGVSTARGFLVRAGGKCLGAAPPPHSARFVGVANPPHGRGVRFPPQLAPAFFPPVGEVAGARNAHRHT